MSNEILFLPDEYVKLKDYMLQTLNPKCKHLQCTSLTRSQDVHRCRLCVGESRVNSGVCHVHAKQQQQQSGDDEQTTIYPEKYYRLFKLNRQRRLVLGFDERLLTNSKLLFADDAIETGLILMIPLAVKANINLWMQTPMNSLNKVYTTSRDAVGTCLIVLLDGHWFTYIALEQNKWVVYNSLDANSERANTTYRPRSTASLLLKTILNNNEIECVTPRHVNDTINLIQVNNKDCGAFALFYVLRFLFAAHNKTNLLTKINAQNVRHYLLIYLLSRGTRI